MTHGKRNVKVTHTECFGGTNFSLILLLRVLASLGFHRVDHVTCKVQITEVVR